MFDSPFFALRTLAAGASNHSRMNEHEWLLVSANQLFNRALKLGWFEQAKAAVFQHPNQLIDLNDAQLAISGRHALGLHTVPLNHIRASFGRAHDFDAQFYPRTDRNRERWQGVALARLQGFALPAISLIQIGSLYGVMDGHHRLSVARALEQLEIEAEITQWEVAEPPLFHESPAGINRWIQTKLVPQWRLS
jgi:hypothetical protein